MHKMSRDRRKVKGLPRTRQPLDQAEANESIATQQETLTRPSASSFSNTGGSVSMSNSEPQTEKALRWQLQALGEMVSTPTIDNVSRRVLWLTNREADVLAKEDGIDEKILSAFCVKHRPKLVINLCMSTGFRDHVSKVDSFAPGKSAGMIGAGTDLGKKRKNSPFCENGQETEDEVEQRLALFMEIVIIPLAEETNALILCSAIFGMCALTRALTKVVSANSQRWPNGKPFTIIYATPLMFHLYFSKKKVRWWERLRGGTQRWKDSDGPLEEAVEKRKKDDPKLPDDKKLPHLQTDLDESGENFILVDSLTGAELDHCLPFNNLMTVLLSHFWQRFPVFAIKTGGGIRPDMLNGAAADPSSLQAANSFLAAGMPVIWVDVRNRSMPQEGSYETQRQTWKLLRYLAFENWKSDCGKLREAGVPGTFDACTMSFFCKVLKHSHPDERAKVLMESRIVDQIWKDLDMFYKGRPERCDFFEHRRAMSGSVRNILFSRHSHSINIHDEMKGNIDRAVFRLATMNRLPEQNLPEGIHLLEEAQHYWERTMKMAFKYKLIYHFLLVVRIVLGWVIVIVTTFFISTTLDVEMDNLFSALLYMLTSAATFCVGLESFLNPKMVWQQCRSQACRLQKMMWHYRTRTESFVIHSHPGTTSPETLFCDQLAQWIKTLVESLESVQGNFFKFQFKPFEKDRFQDDTEPQEDDLIEDFEEALADIWGFSDASLERQKPTELNSHSFLRRMSSHFMGPAVLHRQNSRNSGKRQKPPAQLQREPPAEPEGELPEPPAKPAGELGEEADRQSVTAENSNQGEGGTRKFRSVRAPKVSFMPQEEQPDEPEPLSGGSRLIGKGGKRRGYAKNLNLKPVQAHDYAVWRIEDMKNFYLKKLPWCNTAHTLSKVLVISLTLTSTVLAYLRFDRWVVIFISFAGYVTTWSTFKDYKGKADRFTNTLKNLQDLLRWWQKLKQIEQASIEQSSKFIKTAEFIILAENASWMSAMTSISLDDIQTDEEKPVVASDQGTNNSKGANNSISRR